MSTDSIQNLKSDVRNAEDQITKIYKDLKADYPGVEFELKQTVTHVTTKNGRDEVVACQFSIETKLA